MCVVGAAGRRLDAARRNLATSGNTPVVSGPTPLPRGVNFLLSILPGAHHYKDIPRFKPDAMVALLRNLQGIPLDPAVAAQTQGAQPQHWRSTSNTAQQLQSIQEKYGNGPLSAGSMYPPANPWGT